MSKTINKAMADLVLGLGADPSVLSDNSTVSDYIEDLAGAIKGETEALIDDSEASETKTYSSSKIESLIPEDELPAVTSADNGKLLGVKEGAWSKISIKDAFIVTINEESGTFSLALCPDFSEVLPSITAKGFASLRMNGGAFGSDQMQGGFFSGVGADTQPIYASGIIKTANYGLCAYFIKIATDNTKTLTVEPITPATT